MRCLLFFILFQLCNLIGNSQKLKWMPSHPKEGQQVTIKYKINLSPFKEGDKFYASVRFFQQNPEQGIKKGSNYWHEATLLEKEIILKKAGEYYIGTYIVPKGAATCIINFRNERLYKMPNDLYELNNKPYNIPIYTIDNKLVPGARFPVAIYNYFFSGQIRDESYCKKLLQEEFNENKAYIKKILPAFSYLSMQLSKENKQSILSLIDEVKVSEINDEQSYQDIANAYISIGMKDSSKAIDSILKNKFPLGNWRKEQAKKLFSRFEGKPSAFKDYFDTFHDLYPPSTKDDSSFYFSNLSYAAMNFIADTIVPQKEKFYSIMRDVPDSYNKFAAYYTLATDLIRNQKDTSFAESLLLDCIIAAKKQIQTLDWKPNSPMNHKTWRNEIITLYCLFVKDYADILRIHDDYNTGYSFLKDAFEKANRSYRFLNGIYALYEEKKNIDKNRLLQELTTMITQDSYDKNVRDTYKRLLLKTGKTEDEAEKYITKIEPFNEKEFRESLKKEILNLPIANFSLRNLKGEQVELKKYIGKVIVLDFWASWCIPCREAFPAMQTLINKYKQDTSIVFLFVNTAENIENETERKRLVEKIITEKGYSFNVVFDEKDKATQKNIVASLFDVTAFPTKIIIGKDGMIKLKDVGGGANIKELISKMSIIIDIVQNEK